METACPMLKSSTPPECFKSVSNRKTFQEMYINVGMANCEKRPKQERDDIRFTHTAIPTSFYIFCNMEVCSVGTCINFIHRWCVLPMGVGSKLPRGGSPVKACVG